MSKIIKLPKFNDVTRTIKGDIMILDPRSKVIITLSMVVGVAISIEPFQVFLFALLLIPTTVLYRPKKTVIRRILVTLPIVFILAILLLIVLEDDVTFNLLGFCRTYTPFQFAFLNAYRFTISVAHSSILLESEGSNIEIIDAIGSFKLLKGLLSILLLIHRIASRLQYDYNKMILAASTKGVNLHSGFQLFFKLRIMGRLLTRAILYSDSIGYTLTARGFQGEFNSNTRNWSSEGISVAILVVLCSLLFVLIPILRPPTTTCRI